MPIDINNLKPLDGFLQDRSYIDGAAPTQADVTVFKAFKAAPDASSSPHLARWYNHIKSFENEFSSLPGDSSKGLDAYGPVVGTEAAAGGDDDIDLFGSDDEEVDEEAEKVKAQRLEEYAKKKANKPKPVAKSMVTLEIKPWDDETDLKAMEESVRAIEKDGLVWGLSKLVPVGFGVSKLQVNIVIEDDKVSMEELQEEIEGIEDYVQSSDVAAMSKI